MTDHTGGLRAAEDAESTGPIVGATLVPVEHDLYRNIHKAVRAELFAACHAAGTLDPSDRAGRDALATQVLSTVELLDQHGNHEDTHIQPVLESTLPHLAERVADDHERVDAAMATLTTMAVTLVDAPPERCAHESRRLALDLASFTAAYLCHQDMEERVVMPALEAAIGVDEVRAVHDRLLASIPPEEMTAALARMLPAMNHEDRVELLGAMQRDAPPEAVEGVWNLARIVLSPAALAPLTRRLAPR